jgi:hypothetical protein
MFNPVALKCSEIVAVTQFGEELFENLPVAVATSRAVLTFKVTLQIILYAVVVE